ncbi:GNAT family N-acetyltransferase [Oceanobacillus sp. CAU 1775]
MIIREAKNSDADKLANLIQHVDASSQYMLWEAGERELSPEKQLKMIESLQREANSNIFVAENKNELVGYLFAIGGKARRNKHNVYIVIGISDEHRGKGIGTALFQKLEEWASNHDIHRLELTVIIENEAGINLYKKVGYEVEGTKRKSLYIDDKYVDEYYMSKLI